MADTSSDDEGPLAFRASVKRHLPHPEDPSPVPPKKRRSRAGPRSSAPVSAPPPPDEGEEDALISLLEEDLNETASRQPPSRRKQRSPSFDSILPRSHPASPARSSRAPAHSKPSAPSRRSRTRKSQTNGHPEDVQKVPDELHVDEARAESTSSHRRKGDTLQTLVRMELPARPEPGATPSLANQAWHRILERAAAGIGDACYDSSDEEQAQAEAQDERTHPTLQLELTRMLRCLRARAQDIRGGTLA